MSHWLPHNLSARRGNLEIRQKVIKAVRRYFDEAGFAEVETPILQTCPVIDAHIRAFATDLRGVDGAVAKTMYLHTSPEFTMKKLMAGGVEKLYQICRVFRNAEGSKRHEPEFTMIEWYRAAADYTDIMADCVALLQDCAKTAGIGRYRYKTHECDPFAEAERLTVLEAFRRYAEMDLEPFLPDADDGAEDHTDAFRAAVRAKGLHAADDDGWDDLFFRVMDAYIEPFLGMERPCFLCDYPVALASLSRRKPGDARLAERFELYVCGIELANAFSELTDAAEQRSRFEAEMDLKERLYGERYPLDEEFMKAIELGLPESGGIALGIDRLVMLACGAEDIRDVLWSPVER